MYVNGGEILSPHLNTLNVSRFVYMSWLGVRKLLKMSFIHAS